MPDYIDLRLHPEERLRLLEENVRDYAIFIIDTQGRIASWNRGAKRILGYTEEEAVGMEAARIFTPEDREHGAAEQEQEKARETGRAEDERWHLRKDGSRFWGNGIMTALRDEMGQLRGFAKILRDETLRKVAQDDRMQAEAERAEQERRNAVLQERNRIAREIHDTLAQNLTAIHLQLEALKGLVPAENSLVMARIVRMQEIAQQGMSETRRSVRALRPQILEERGLAEALLRMAEEVRVGASLEVSCVVYGEPVPLLPQIEDQLLRIGQESVTNVLRHANATTLELTLRFEPERLTLEVHDNGQGFDPKLRQEGFGLLGLQERAESIGAKVELLSGGGQGTRVVLTLPLPL